MQPAQARRLHHKAPGSLRFTYGSGTGGGFSPGSSSLIVDASGADPAINTAMLRSISKIACNFCSVAPSVRALTACLISAFVFISCSEVKTHNPALRSLDAQTYRIVENDSLETALCLLSKYVARPLERNTETDTKRHNTLVRRAASVMYRLGMLTEACALYTSGRIEYGVFGGRQQLRSLRKAGRACMEARQVAHARRIYASARAIAYHYGWVDELRMINGSETDQLSRLDSMGVDTSGGSGEVPKPPAGLYIFAGIAGIAGIAGTALAVAVAALRKERRGDTIIHQHGYGGN